MHKTCRLLFAGLLCSAGPLLLQAQTDKTQSVRTKALTPEEELAGFKVPEGFVVELVASERDGIVNPVDLTFDDAGRLWTQTARMYPLDPVADIQWNDLLRLMDNEEAQKEHPAFRKVQRLYRGEEKGTDRILIVSDLYSGKPAKVTAWAEGLAIPMSVLPYRNGAYVAQGSELFFLEDRNGDGKADTRTPLFTGFGFTDTHTMAHVLVRGPGNWVHFSHGALNRGEVSSLKSNTRLRMDFSKIARFSMDGIRMELVSAGLNNIWGFQLRANGEWYGSEANDMGYSAVPLEPGAAFPGIGNEKLRPYQPFMPPLHAFRVGGTGLSGMAFAEDASGSFPPEYRDVAFLANPITGSINAVRIVRNADGTFASSRLPDLLTSDDDWFRPVNIEFGPDGCLYIADWYNKIVSHNELPTSHPDRDKTHGRIWRIRHVSQKKPLVPDFYEMPVTELPAYLGSPSLWAKRAAWHQLSDRPKEETRPLAIRLVTLAADSLADEVTRIHALWALESMTHYQPELWKALLKSPSAAIRREAVRSLTAFSMKPATIAPLLGALVDDTDATVRAQVLRTLGEAGNADAATVALLVRACRPELPGNALGGSYERKFERFLARKALEKFPDTLLQFAGRPLPPGLSAENMLWATLALPEGSRETTFLGYWREAGVDLPDEQTFVGMAGMLHHAGIRELARSLLANPAHARVYAAYALGNRSQVQSAALGELLREPARTLLKSAEQEEVDLGLDLAGQFKMGGMREFLVPLAARNTAEPTLKLLLRVLEADPSIYKDLLRQLSGHGFGFDVRASAIGVLAGVDKTSATEIAGNWATSLGSEEKGELVKRWSATPQGAEILLGMYDRKLVRESEVDLPSAERLAAANPSDKRPAAILAGVKKREADKKKAFRRKLERYLVLAEKNTGNPAEGKVLFRTCLACHQVGGEGQRIAPALDGSASRQNEALLTALLDPDAAVEGGYAVYRVSRKDGSTLEGYLVGRDARGTTLAFMGGATVFTEAAEIRSQGFLSGKSFMVKGLIDNYSDKQVADLLAYIRTLK